MNDSFFCFILDIYDCPYFVVIFFFFLQQTSDDDFSLFVKWCKNFVSTKNNIKTNYIF